MSVHCHSCSRMLAEGESVWADEYKVIDTSGMTVTFSTRTRYTCDPCSGVPPICGMCTACGAVEVALVKVTGTRDLSASGEHAAYPTGHGCEVCS